MLKQLIMGAGCLAWGVLQAASVTPTPREAWSLEVHDEGSAELTPPETPGGMWRLDARLPRSNSFVWCGAMLSRPEDLRNFTRLRLAVTGDGSNQTLRVILGNARENRFLQTEPRMINFSGAGELVFDLGSPGAGPSGDFADTYWNGGEFDFSAVDFIRLRLDRAGGESDSTLGIGAVTADDQPFQAAGKVPQAWFAAGQAGHFTAMVDAGYRRHLEEQGIRVVIAGNFDTIPREANLIAFTRSASEGKDNYPETLCREVESFVREGGGLLVMTGFTGYGDFARAARDLNQLLEPYDILFHREKVTDPANEVNVEWTSRYTFYETGRLNREHPLTAGLERFYYPGGKAEYDISTGRLTPGKEWQVLIEGGTSEAPAVIAAAREFGKGRVVVVAIDPMYPLENGSHPAYDGYALLKGDTRAFYDGLIAWLCAPSFAMGRGGAPLQRPASRIAPRPEAAFQAQQSNERDFPGVLAVLPGDAPEESWGEYLRQARANGDAFAVLALRIDSESDAPAYGRFAELCGRHSDDSFLALPAIYLAQESRGNRLILNPSRCPTAAELADLYWPGYFFSIGMPGTFLDRPGQNAKSPWYLKFYTGLTVLGYEDSRLADDAEAAYIDLVASDYRLIPAAVTHLSSPEALGRYSGARTVVRAGSLAEVPEGLKTFAGSGKSYLSTGPALEEFTLVKDGAAYRQGDAFEWSPGRPNPAVIHFKASGLAADGTATLYMGSRPWRSWTAGPDAPGRAFELDVRANSSWVAVWRDAAGNRLISNSLRALNPLLNYTMCVDKQNMIFNFNQPELERSAVILNCWITGMDGGLFLVNVPPEEIAPWGEDVTWGAISGFEVVPGFLKNGGEVVKSGGLAELARRCCVASTDDLIVADTVIDDEFMTGKSRFTIFRPALYGLSLLLIEGEFTAKRDFEVAPAERVGMPTYDLPAGLTESTAAGGDSVTVRMLRLMGSTTVKPLSDWRLLESSGRRSEGAFELAELPHANAFRPAHRSLLAAGDGVVLHPSRAGNWAVFALADGCRAELGVTNSTNHALASGAYRVRNYLEIGYELPDHRVRAGQRFEQKLLMVLDSGADPDAGSFATLQQSFAMMPEFLKLRRGNRDEGAIFPVTVAADGGAVEGLLHAGSTVLPDFPLRVIGLENNAACVLVDLRRHTAKTLPVYDGETIALLPSAAACDFFIGHPVVCGDPAVTVGLRLGDEWLIDLHNPTPAAITTEVRPVYHAGEAPFTVTLQPGEVKSWRLPGC